MIGKSTRQLRSDRHDRSFYRDLSSTLQTTGQWKGEIWCKRKIGEVFPQRLTISCVKNTAGEVTHYVADGQDITEERKAAADESAILIARQVQQGLFPAGMPCVAGFDIAGAVLPAERASGDYFDFISLKRGYLGIVVADICGHGLGPALLMAQLQAYVRALAETDVDPGAILSKANRLFAQSQVGHFATLFLCRIDLKSRKFTYASAAHEGHLLRQNGKSRVLNSTALPLGVDERATIRTVGPLQLTSGDLIVLPTDGIVETRRSDHTFFGKQRLLDTVRMNQHEPAEQIVQSLFEAARTFAHGDAQKDDMTAVICKTLTL